MVGAAGPKPAPGAPLRAVLCDAVGTLLYPDPPVVEAYLSAGRRHGSRLAADEIARRFRAVWQADGLGRRLPAETPAAAAAPLATSPAREHDRWRRIVAAIFADVNGAAAQRLFADLWDHFAQPQHWRLFADVAPALAELSALGLVWGVASNFDQRLLAIAAGHAPLAACTQWFISSEVGWAKPAAGFYAAIEARLGLPPQELLLLGDDLENDVVAPGRRGWRTIHLRRSPVADEPAATAAVSSLTEAAALIRRLREAAP